MDRREAATVIVGFLLAACGKIAEPAGDSQDAAVNTDAGPSGLAVCNGTEGETAPGQPICQQGNCTRVGEKYCAIMQGTPKEYDCPQGVPGGGALPGKCSSPAIFWDVDAQPPCNIYCCK